MTDETLEIFRFEIGYCRIRLNRSPFAISEPPTREEQLLAYVDELRNERDELREGHLAEYQAAVDMFIKFDHLKDTISEIAMMLNKAKSNDDDGEGCKSVWVSKALAEAEKIERNKK